MSKIRVLHGQRRTGHISSVVLAQLSAAHPAFYTPTPRLDHFIIQYSPPHSPPPFCDFCGSLPPICLSTHPPLPSSLLTTAHLHPSSITLAALYLLQPLTFILPLWPSQPHRLLTTALASAHHHTHLHPSVTFVALYLFCGRPIVPSWHSRPIPLVHSSPSRPLCSLTTALAFTHL